MRLVRLRSLRIINKPQRVGLESLPIGESMGSILVRENVGMNPNALLTDDGERLLTDDGERLME